MRTTLFALALLVAAPTFAATPSDAPPPDLAIVSAVEVDGVPVIEADARVIIRTPMVMTASFTLRDANGKTVREYADRLLWDGESVLNLDMEDLPSGAYSLVVTSRLGTQSISLIIV